MLDVLLEALLDTLKIVPVLLLVYLLISYLTHKKEEPYKFLTKKGKWFGPLFGSLLGTIPQCGFSSVMADLFSKRAITLGTLFAVFLATSDEALPILISNPSFYKDLGIILGIKFLVGILFGYLIDFTISLIEKSKAKKHNQKHENCSCGHHINDLEKVEVHHTHSHSCSCDHENKKHSHTGDCCSDNIFLDAIIHTLKIAGFILIVNLVFGITIYFVFTA